MLTIAPRNMVFRSFGTHFDMDVNLESQNMGLSVGELINCEDHISKM